MTYLQQNYQTNLSLILNQWQQCKVNNKNLFVWQHLQEKVWIKIQIPKFKNLAQDVHTKFSPFAALYSVFVRTSTALTSPFISLSRMSRKRAASSAHCAFIVCIERLKSASICDHPGQSLPGRNNEETETETWTWKPERIPKDLTEELEEKTRKLYDKRF